MKFQSCWWYCHRICVEFEHSCAHVKFGYVFMMETIMLNYFSWTMFLHFVQWEWYNELVHEIPVILVVLSLKMDGI